MADKKKYVIDIAPRILELLGPSLYTNIYYILAELIANAYDANANNVYIIQESDAIIVEDDGNGMSYEQGDVDKFLNVAQETRTSEEDSYVKGSDNKRKKMGRKGVGKLAALSVSENVKVMTRKDGDLSGFILSRNVPDNHELEPIPDNEVAFKKIKGNGTSIVMESPQYKLHKTLPAIRGNLLKIFPFVNDEFKIHILVEGKSLVIDSFESDIIRGLGGLIILGDEFNYLSDFFDSNLKNKQLNAALLTKREAYEKELSLKGKDGKKSNYLMRICGWAGVYRTTAGKKKQTNDFPDNFISLLSNKKLGEYNILPIVGKNSLNESYIVGQLHVDLFEDSSLPDMALSNRQGYKSDDERYEEVIKFIREDILPKLINLRTKYATYLKDEKNTQKDKKDKDREEQLRKQVDEFKQKASSMAAKKISSSLKLGDEREEEVEKMVEKALNSNLPSMGLKKKVDESKRKILISHTKKDKDVADFIYQLLLFNNIPPKEIIYTNSDNSDSRIPQKQSIFEYLREFFIESYSTEKIYVLYITSQDMAKSWGAVSEVGAGWITKSKHDIINVPGEKYLPQKPLDVDCEWANVIKNDGNVTLEKLEADKIAEKVLYACKALGFQPKSKRLILQEIDRLAFVEA